MRSVEESLAIFESLLGLLVHLLFTHTALGLTTSHVFTVTELNLGILTFSEKILLLLISLFVGTEGLNELFYGHCMHQIFHS